MMNVINHRWFLKPLSIANSLKVLIISCGLGFISAACASSPTAITPNPTNGINASKTPTPTTTNLPTPITLPRSTDSQTATSSLSTSPRCFENYMIPIDFLQGSFLLLARDSAGVQVFDVQTLQQVNFLQASSNLNGPVVALSPDGRMVAWAFEDGTIQSIRLLDQTVLFTINSGQISPIKLKFSPKGGKLFSVSPDGSIKVWDDQGILENTFQPGGELVNFGISPDGTILATIPSDGPVTLWNLDDFHKIIELGGSGGYDTSEIAFSPNGKYLAADLATGLYLWRVQDGNELLSAKDSINSLAVAYSPDGRFLAYSDQNDIILSSPDSSQIIRTLTGHLLPVFELLFSPDGSQLISADDTQTYVWRVEDGKLLAIGKNKCP